MASTKEKQYLINRLRVIESDKIQELNKQVTYQKSAAQLLAEGIITIDVDKIKKLVTQGITSFYLKDISTGLTEYQIEYNKQFAEGTQATQEKARKIRQLFNIEIDKIMLDNDVNLLEILDKLSNIDVNNI